MDSTLAVITGEVEELRHAMEWFRHDMDRGHFASTPPSAASPPRLDAGTATFALLADRDIGRKSQASRLTWSALLCAFDPPPSVVVRPLEDPHCRVSPLERCRPRDDDEVSATSRRWPSPNCTASGSPSPLGDCGRRDARVTMRCVVPPGPPRCVLPRERAGPPARMSDDLDDRWGACRARHVSTPPAQPTHTHVCARCNCELSYDGAPAQARSRQQSPRAFHSSAVLPPHVDMTVWRKRLRHAGVVKSTRPCAGIPRRVESPRLSRHGSMF